jgi:hypothetical protein
MRFRVPETLFNIAHFLKHNTAKKRPRRGVTRAGLLNAAGRPVTSEVREPLPGAVALVNSDQVSNFPCSSIAVVAPMLKRDYQRRKRA